MDVRKHMDSVDHKRPPLNNPKRILKTYFQLVAPFIYEYHEGAWKFKADIARGEYKKVGESGSEIFFGDLEEFLMNALDTDKISDSYQSYEVIENMKIADRNYDEIIISGGLFSGVTFKSVHFNGCTFFASRMENCRFIDCTFSECKFHFSHILHSQFHTCLFEGSFYEISPIKKCHYELCEIDTKTKYFIAKYDGNSMMGHQGRIDLSEDSMEMEIQMSSLLAKELKDVA